MSLTCVIVVNCLCDGLLQVVQLDLLSLSSSLTVLQSHFVYHLLSCSAAHRKHKISCLSLCNKKKPKKKNLLL